MTKQKIIISRATAPDSVKILKFMHRVHKANIDNLPPIIDRFALPWITNILSCGVCFNACIGGRVVGTVGMSKESYPWNKYKPHLRIQWLHTLNDFIDTNVAHDLVEESHAISKEMGCDLLVDIPSYLQDVKRCGGEKSFLYHLSGADNGKAE